VGEDRLKTTMAMRPTPSEIARVADADKCTHRRPTAIAVCGPRKSPTPAIPRRSSLEPVFLALEPVGCATSARRRRSRKAPLAIRAGIALRVRAKLSAVVSILECMFESEACVADWERTGRVPVPARLLAPPDLTVWVAAGPPLVDEFIDAEILAGGGGSVEDGGADIDDGSPASDAVLGNGCRSEAGPGEDASATDGGPVGEGLSAASGSAEGDVALADAPEWAGLAPGVVLATVLTAVDVSGLSEFALVEAVAGWERLAGWVAAEQTRVVAELSRRPLFAQLSGFRDGLDPRRCRSRVRCLPGRGAR
jgi:hypothetical protein